MDADIDSVCSEVSSRVLHEAHRAGNSAAVLDNCQASERVNDINANLMGEAVGLLVVHGNGEEALGRGLLAGHTQPPPHVSREGGRVLVQVRARRVLQLLVEAQHCKHVPFLNVPRPAARVLLAVIEVVAHLLQCRHAVTHCSRALPAELSLHVDLTRAAHTIPLVELPPRLLHLLQHEGLHIIQRGKSGVAQVHRLVGLRGLQTVLLRQSQLLGGRGEEESLLKDLIVSVELVSQHLAGVGHAAGVPEERVMVGGALVREYVGVLVGKVDGAGPGEVVEMHGLEQCSRGRVLGHPADGDLVEPLQRLATRRPHVVDVTLDAKGIGQQLTVPVRHGLQQAVQAARLLQALVVPVMLEYARGVIAAGPHPSALDALVLVSVLTHSGAGADVYVVNVDGWVAQRRAVPRHSGRVLRRHEHAVLVGHELLLQPPDVLPAHLHPVIPPSGHEGSDAVHRPAAAVIVLSLADAALHGARLHFVWVEAILPASGVASEELVVLWDPLIPVEFPHAFRRLVPVHHGVLEGVSHGHPGAQLLATLGPDLRLVACVKWPSVLRRHSPVIAATVGQVSQRGSMNTLRVAGRWTAPPAHKHR
mmetsp:Transcript_1475/g.2612  ORF Transcript_1475/g.2612 Transcript_1475/m.2612 type:complete len:591 (-) Transcript_1475:80-1852(-)